MIERVPLVLVPQVCVCSPLYCKVFINYDWSTLLLSILVLNMYLLVHVFVRVFHMQESRSTL